MGGSSPLTRGKRMRARRRRRRAGLIPAHAGKTWVKRSLGSWPWAHPRSRGENVRATLTGAEDQGSSPLTRGKLAYAVCVDCRARLIPAHAGKTDVPLSREEMKRAHPRSRGENVGTMPGAGPLLGSSPLTRGKRRRRLCDATLRGLIPAHAGKTRAWRAPGRRERAHPRSRGENVLFALRHPSGPGSSPLTRGKLQLAVVLLSTVRLIPAHAGKTGAALPWSRPGGAHPRSRGENGGLGWSPRRSQGSSPLTLGKPADRARGLAVAGLIPAHAGKTMDTRA